MTCRDCRRSSASRVLSLAGDWACPSCRGRGRKSPLHKRYKQKPCSRDHYYYSNFIVAYVAFTEVNYIRGPEPEAPENSWLKTAKHPLLTSLQKSNARSLTSIRSFANWKRSSSDLTAKPRFCPTTFTRSCFSCWRICGPVIPLRSCRAGTKSPPWRPARFSGCPGSSSFDC